MLPSHSGGSAPTQGWCAARWGEQWDPGGTSLLKRVVVHAGTACTAARVGVGDEPGCAHCGRQSLAGKRQGPASGSRNSPGSDWANSRFVSIPRRVGTSDPHSWS